MKPPIKLRTLLLAQHRARKTRKRLDAHFLLGMGIADSTSLKGLRRNPARAVGPLTPQTPLESIIVDFIQEHLAGQVRQ